MLGVSLGLGSAALSAAPVDDTPIDFVGDITITSNAQWSAAHFNRLRSITGNLSVTGVTFATLSAPILESVSGGIDFGDGSSTLVTVNLPVLETASGIRLVSHSQLTTLNIDSLTTFTAGNGLIIFSCPEFAHVDLSALQHVAGGFFFGVGVAGSKVTSIDLSALENLDNANGLFSFTNNSLLTSFTFGAGLKKLSVNSTANFANCALTQASVDNILTRLAALDGTNGTTAYSSKTVQLNGGTNAAPGAGGLTAKTTLEARGCTVNVN